MRPGGSRKRSAAAADLLLSETGAPGPQRLADNLPQLGTSKTLDLLPTDRRVSRPFLSTSGPYWCTTCRNQELKRRTSRARLPNVCVLACSSGCKYIPSSTSSSGA